MEALYYGRVSMTTSELQDVYDANLEHLAEPDTPNGRETATGADLASFEALWLTQALRDYAHYGDHPSEDHRGIARAYVEYIDRKVRDEGRNYIRLYAHTQTAADTLMGAMFHISPDDRTGEVLKQAVASPLADLFLAHAEED